MKDLSEYERPNTVSGLLAKHKELSALLTKYQKEIVTLADDLDSLTTVIRLFDPGAIPHPMKGSVTKPRVKRGAIKRFVLDQFREADGPLTSKTLTHGWADHSGTELTDATYPSMRQKITACIKDCLNQGLVEVCGREKDVEHFGSYKLYRLKEGGL